MMRPRLLMLDEPTLGLAPIILEQISQIIETLLGSKNHLHNNYQDFQAFLDHGGHIGLQHDPLLYGAYALNPFLVSVELVPMMIVKPAPALVQ